MSHRKLNWKRPNRRAFAAATVGIVASGGCLPAIAAATLQEGRPSDGEAAVQESEEQPPQPTEMEFSRDYDPPSFQPSWKNPQINRTLVQDFVIFAHSDADMTKTLLDQHPGLIHAAMDWGNGDFETALGGASHMGRHDIVEFLLSRGARIDIFCAAMMGMLSTVTEMLTIEPALIDAKGPHGFSLHVHGQVGQERSQEVLDYLQSIKEVELRPLPFLKKREDKDDQ